MNIYDIKPKIHDSGSVTVSVVYGLNNGTLDMIGLDLIQFKNYRLIS